MSAPAAAREQVPKGALAIACNVQLGDANAPEVLAGDASGDTQQAVAAAETKRRFSGLAHSGAIMRHWYWDQLAVDLDSLEVLRTDIPVLRDHSSFEILGYTDKITVSKSGIEVEGWLLGVTDSGKEVLSLLEAGMPLQMSMWVPPGSVERLEAGVKAKVNGQSMTGPGAIFRGAQLREVTITALGVDQSTNATALSARGGPDQQVEVQTLSTREQTMTEQSKEASPPTAKTLAEKYPEVHKEVSEFAADAARKAERERCTSIFALGSKHGIPAEVVTKAIEDGDDRAKFTEACLDHVSTRKADRLQQHKDQTAEPSGNDDGAAPENGGNGVETFTPGGDGDAKIAAMPEGKEKWKAEFAASEELQKAFFGGEEHYIAHRATGGK